MISRDNIQFECLKLISLFGDLCISHCAHELGVESNRISPAFLQLRIRGLIEPTNDRTDGLSMLGHPCHLHRLTEPGQAFLRATLAEGEGGRHEPE